MEQVATKISELKLLAEGKTKQIFDLSHEQQHAVLVRSKDSLTAFNAKRRDEVEGKSTSANRTTCNNFNLLKACGVPTHFVREGPGENEFIAENCDMVPIEWVARRVATGSFLKRNPGVPEGYVFAPLKIETFFKDDANDDPQWSDEQILTKNFVFNGRNIGYAEVRLMKRLTEIVFRILERAWQTASCTLVDLKIEFGVTKSGALKVADVIDNDSWRVWPNGDKRLQLDKQFYRDLSQVTDDALKELKKNYDKVAELTGSFLHKESFGRVVIIMGSKADGEFATTIQNKAAKLGITRVEKHVCSAHKTTAEALELITRFEADNLPTVFICIAGRSNGLGPVVAANSTLPVINAPPCGPDWAAQDVWSSLRMPSGIGCSTVLGADEAALAAAKILGSNDHIIFGKILAAQYENVASVLEA